MKLLPFVGPMGFKEYKIGSITQTSKAYTYLTYHMDGNVHCWNLNNNHREERWESKNWLLEQKRIIPINLSIGCSNNHFVLYKLRGYICIIQAWEKKYTHFSINSRSRLVAGDQQYNKLLSFLFQLLRFNISLFHSTRMKW